MSAINLIELIKEDESSCDTCGNKFKTKQGLYIHKQIMHIDSKLGEYDDIASFMCTKCNKIFTSQKTLNSHKQTHILNKFICNICNATFWTYQTLFQHINFKHKVSKYVCNICEERYTDVLEYKQHRMLHSNLLFGTVMII